MYICLCRGVTEKQIRSEVLAGATTFEDIQERLEVSTCCGMCKESAINLINDTLQEHETGGENVINLWPPQRRAI